MRDPRFDWGEGFRTRRAELDGQADEIERQKPWPAQAVDVLRSWWRSEGGRASHESEEAWGARAGVGLSRALEHAGVDKDQARILSNAIRRQTSDDDPSTIAARRLVGTAVAREVASGPPNRNSLRTAEKFIGGIWTAADHFVPEIVSAASDAAWHSMLVDSLGPPEELVETRFGVTVEGVRRLAEVDSHDRARGLAYYCWNSGRHDRIGLSSETVVRLRILLGLGPDVFSQALEILPFQAVRRLAFQWLSIHEDRDLVASVIRHSPLVFDGNEWTGNVVAALAVESAIRHVASLSQHVERVAGGLSTRERQEQAVALLEPLRKTELPTWMREAFLAARERKDGSNCILLAVAHATSAEAGSHDLRSRWSPVSLVWEAASATLPQELTVRDIRDLASAAELTSPCGAYAIMSAALGRAPQEAWRWYVDLLVGQDGWLRNNIVGGVSFLTHAMLGYALLHCDDPVAEWQRAWGRLFAHRQRARFDRSNSSLFDPSRHLVMSGFGLLALTSRGAFAGEGERALWAVLRRSVRSLCSYNDDMMRLPAALYATGFEVAGGIFGSSWWDRAVAPEWDVLRGQVVQLVRVAARLSRLVSWPDLDAAFSSNGVTLAVACREVKDAIEAQDHRIRDKEVLECIRSLEELATNSARHQELPRS